MIDLPPGRIGIALGSGSARGVSHIGVLRALLEAGIKPDVVAGTSMGAAVGAFYAAGELDAFEEWVRSLEKRSSLLGYFDLSFGGGGILRAQKVFDALTRRIPDRAIESLPIPFGAVATDLTTGQEVWLRSGSLMQALRASVAIPGLVTPAPVDGRWLVDGGLVDPVPVSLCRAMGAGAVIAVDLNTTLLSRPPPRRDVSAADAAPVAPDTPRMPSIVDVMASSVSIMQHRITRSRAAGDPPDLMITPRLADFGIMSFERSALAIEEGRRAVARALAAAGHEEKLAT